MQLKHTEVFNSLATPPPDFKPTADFYPLCNDKVFKEIFSQPEFMDELKLLAYVALAKDGYELSDIQEIGYAKTEFTSPHAGGKAPRFDINLDVIMSNGEGKYVNIEMQREPTTDYGERSEYYISVAVVDSLGAGGLYNDRPDIEGIHLLNHKMFKNLDPNKYQYTFRFREDDDHNLVLPLTPKIHFVELPKIRSMSHDEVAENPILSVLKLISLEKKEEIMEYAQTNPPVERLVGGVMEFNRDSENVRRVNYMELLLKQEGARERQAEKIKNAKNALAKGIPPQLVSEIFGLSIERVKKLANN